MFGFKELKKQILALEAKVEALEKNHAAMDKELAQAKAGVAAITDATNKVVNKEVAPAVNQVVKDVKSKIAVTVPLKK
jgi:hypothetical protein